MIAKKVLCDICGEEVNCNYADAKYVLLVAHDPSLTVYRPNGLVDQMHMCDGCGLKVLDFTLALRSGGRE